VKMRIFTPGPTPLPEEVKISQVGKLFITGPASFPKYLPKFRMG